MQKRIRQLENENQELYEYKSLADAQTEQLDSLSRSIASMNLVNKRTSQEWSKTVRRMTQARIELEAMAELMGRIQKENTELKQKIQTLQK